MTGKYNTKKPENALNFREESSASDTKPEKLAKIMYEGIVRYTRAKDAPVREKNSGFAVDFSGDRRVTVRTEEY
ncbi:MAG: hypothetical protein LBB25_00430 [Holosporaceae bacterium]|jgi:hypothetical protein|nr:hypothetical protein [Holosporaceae bacterium]